jgi:hypothetical protein
MRHFVRPSLPQASQAYFDAKTRKIKAKRKAQTRKAEADRLWKHGRSTKAVMGAVDTLRTMNSLLSHCMYCEHDHATAFKDNKWRSIIEHWEPVVEAPHRTFDWNNHFLACNRCNSMIKHDEFPRDANNNPLLLHPVNDNPTGHLELLPSTGELRALNGSVKGRKTVDFFQLDDFSSSRASVWEASIRFLIAYDKHVSSGAQQQADLAKKHLLHQGHRSVVAHLVNVAAGPNGAVLTDPAIPTIIQNHGVAQWL